MADVHKLSERVIDVAERTSAVADAAQGKKVRRGGMPARWLLLPAAGAGLYALMTNRSFTRQAKSVMNQAKERASDLPEDLVDRVQQTTGQKEQLDIEQSPIHSKVREPDIPAAKDDVRSVGGVLDGTPELVRRGERALTFRNEL